MQAKRLKIQNVVSANNGVANKKILEYINSADEMFEREPIQRLAQEKQVSIYKHYGFWKCMDNRRDKEILTEIWEKGNAPWK